MKNEGYEIILESTEIKVEVNFQRHSLRIHGVEYSFEIFNDIAFPFNDRFYQISKDGEMRILKQFRGVGEFTNGTIVIAEV